MNKYTLIFLSLFQLSSIAGAQMSPSTVQVLENPPRSYTCWAQDKHGNTFFAKGFDLDMTQNQALQECYRASGPNAACQALGCS